MLQFKIVHPIGDKVEANKKLCQPYHFQQLVPQKYMNKMLEEIGQLTQLHDVTRSLQHLLVQQREAEAELESQLTLSEQLGKTLLQLRQDSDEQVELVLADAEQLAESVGSTATLADKVSTNVRKLDQVQTNVEKALQRLQLLQQRSEGLTGLQNALDAANYDKAAQLCSQLERIQSSLVGDKVSPQMQAEMQELSELKSKLQGIVRTQLEDAMRENSSEQIVRYLKIFTLLGMQTEGSSMFLHYCKDSLSLKLNNLYHSLDDDDSVRGNDEQDPNFVNKLSDMLREILTTVTQYFQIVSENFGQGAAEEFVIGMHNQSDGGPTRLVARFLEHFRLAAIVERLRPQSGNATAVDPIQIEKYLALVVAICKRCGEYNRLIIDKIKVILSPKPVPRATIGKLQAGAFNTKVRECVGYYLGMEEFYLDESVRKAISINEVVEESLTSSMVEDTFYILKMTGMRTLAVQDVQCAAAVITQLNNVLANTYMQALVNGLQQAPQQFIAALNRTGEQEKAPMQAVIAVNNCDVSKEYVEKLSKELQNGAAQVFSSAGDIDRVGTLIEDLSKTASDIGRVLAQSLDTIVNEILSKLREGAESLQSTDYVVKDEEYQDVEGQSTWVELVCSELQFVYEWLNSNMSQNALELLVTIMIAKIAQRAEAVLKQKKFNQLGGLQLERDVRALVGVGGNLVSGGVRDRLSRLNQMATVLCLESPEEFLDYWGDNSGVMQWNFSKEEIKIVMRMRIDFTEKQIQAVQL
eukprot:TRINITY_DN1067_c2_g1_i1.p1 TRINITY_DN1067_c2_g1~~TRINITY_DN1067_c2_g1_i1.p1  ORF type:complete len:753 (-),score=108.49 TRINITY_DN1067_c2_g1_i1:482-2740(-)